MEAALRNIVDSEYESGETDRKLNFWKRLNKAIRQNLETSTAVSIEKICNVYKHHYSVDLVNVSKETVLKVI